MNKSKLNNLEILGIIFMLIIGIFLKNCFSIFNADVWTVMIGAVNSGIWENMKCYTLPYIVWGCIEFCIIRLPFKKFITAKALGLYSILILGSSLFLILSSVTGSVCILSDPISSIIYCIVPHLISLMILHSDINTDNFIAVSLCFFVIFFCMYLSFTIYPPKVRLFKDFKTESYGIPKNKFKIDCLPSLV